MPGTGQIKATQVSRIGETPAEAIKRQKAEAGGAEVEAPKGTEVKGPLTPAHLAAIEAAEGGFGGGPTEESIVEEVETGANAPSPGRAVEMIRQLTQDKLQLQAELDAALTVCERYRDKFGDLD